MRIQLQNNNYVAKVGIGGGPVTYLAHAVTELARRGHQVSVLCRTPNGSGASAEQHAAATVYYHEDLPIHGRQWLVQPLVLGLRLRRLIPRYVRGAEVVLARNPTYAYATAKASPGHPLIYVAPGNPYREMLLDMPAARRRERLYRRLLAWQEYYIERVGLRGADHVVVFSEMKRRETVDGYGIDPGKISVIAPGYPPPAPGDPAANAALRAALEIPAEAPVVLSLCRLVPHKNLPLLLRAFARLATAGAYLVIVSDGEERPALERLAADLGIAGRTRFTGRQPDVARYYAIAGVYVLPSLYEAFGFTYLEAMAAGVPCIGLRADYPRIVLPTAEIVEDGVTGFCVGNAVEELRHALDRILGDPGLRRRMGEAARQRCAERYSWQRHFDGVLRLAGPPAAAGRAAA
ncbi:MAG TPA: glycosyltransferase family 4 protein [Candidatus Methylomirabilis sp.]|jgi:glycosyltransferase involved in cell wall biosynthesis